ncbi:hypothetical protein MRX96_047284 [Rhipicephalus microplus]
MTFCGRDWTASRRKNGGTSLRSDVAVSSRDEVASQTGLEPLTGCLCTRLPSDVQLANALYFKDATLMFNLTSVDVVCRSGGGATQFPHTKQSRT